MYQVLYRKWRPRTFAQVYGQPTVTTALQNELKTGRLAHAYLFTGSRGTGKTTCAKILSKAVNCLSPIDGNPCNECELCRAIDSGATMDVVEIDAAANNGVDNIRELREEVNFSPAMAKYRVYIIDEVHELSSSAFNALLKTLEEPPEHVIFILATTEVHKLPATILSRCQRFDFGRIPPQDIAARMQYVAEQEQFSLTEEAALLIARLADGAMRDALSLLDQCLSRSRAIDADVVAQATGMAGREHLYALTKAVRERNNGAAWALVDQLHNASKDMERLCVEWIDFFRNLMILKSVPQPEELIIATAEELRRMGEEADKWELTALLHTLTALQQTLDRLRSGVSRRVEMEMTMLRLCEPSLDSTNESLLRRVKQLEDAVRGGLVAAPAPAPVAKQAEPSREPTPEPASVPAPAAPAAETPAPAAEVAPPPPPAEEQRLDNWTDVLDMLRTSCPPLFGVLSDSTATLCAADRRLFIETDNELFRVLVNAADNKNALIQAIRAVTGQSYRIATRRRTHTEKNDQDPLAAFIQESKSKGVVVDVQ